MMDIGNATASEYDGKSLQVQVDGYGDKDARPPYGDAIMVNGVLHRPDDPGVDADGEAKPEESCAQVYFWEGGRLHPIAANDPRIFGKMPALEKGDTAIACADGTFILLSKTKGVTVYVPDGAGSASALEISRAGVIQARTKGGAGMVLNGANALLHSNGGAYIELKSDGSGTLCGNFNLKGSIQPLAPIAPAPAPGVIQGT